MEENRTTSDKQLDIPSDNGVSIWKKMIKVSYLSLLPARVS